MAVSASNLTSGSSASAGTSFSTTSVSPTSDRLILLFVYLRNGSSTNPTVSSISGNSLTWVKVNSVTYDTTSSTRRSIEVWRALGTATSGAITITTTESETGAEWSVDEFSGIDTSGTNGSGAIVQSVTNTGTGTGVNSLTVTLAAFGSSNNGTYGAFGNDTGSDTTTAGTGFTKIGSIANSNANVNSSSATEFRNDNDTSVDITWSTSTSTDRGGIAIEIKAAASSLVKTVNGLAIASVKTINGLSISSIKNVNGLTNV